MTEFSVYHISTTSPNYMHITYIVCMHSAEEQL